MSGAPTLSSVNVYDQVPYTSRAFAVTHPEHLAAMGTLFGMSPTSPAHARVLELGSAAGGNILPVACSYPEAQFLGIDYSKVQVEEGKRNIQAYGLTNAAIEQQDILEFDPAAHGKFDYIICHGVFSWVGEKIREKILSICKECLPPQGIAYISYNTYPGWKMREIIRDMMNFHAGARPTPAEKVTQSRAILEFIHRFADPQTAFGKLLSNEADIIKAAPNDYLLHEHLEETNLPFYFKDFMGLAHKHGLNYVAEAHIDEMMPHFQGPEVLKALETVSGGNILMMEQYIDFFRNRRFRRTLLTLAENTPNLTRRIDPENLRRFYIAAFFSADPVPLTEVREQKFTDPEGRTINSQVPTVRAALLALSEAWPGTLRFNEWLENTRKILGGAQPNDENLLNELLVRGFCGGLIRLRTNPMVAGSANLDKPVAFAPARLQAQTNQNEATTIWHNTIKINDLQRVVTGMLDGTRNRDEIIAEIVRKCQAREWNLGHEGVPVTDPAKVRELISPVLPTALNELQKSGILIPNNG